MAETETKITKTTETKRWFWTILVVCLMGIVGLFAAADVEENQTCTPGNYNIQLKNDDGIAVIDFECIVSSSCIVTGSAHGDSLRDSLRGQIVGRVLHAQGQRFLVKGTMERLERQVRFRGEIVDTKPSILKKVFGSVSYSFDVTL